MHQHHNSFSMTCHLLEVDPSKAESIYDKENQSNQIKQNKHKHFRTVIQDNIDWNDICNVLMVLLFLI